ncbi:hypothetical protein EVAR_90023_1 [Eumeta japonica]|uniref:Uncharacterized protein n=1 Tax=Eumeta variegata TaxID=151549 RepID=A0A4C1WV42_EUMVA|nr:hypothetical protein EVAR_90023_1 [Eumeta japonica]
MGRRHFSNGKDKVIVIQSGCFVGDRSRSSLKTTTFIVSLLTRLGGGGARSTHVGGRTVFRSSAEWRRARDLARRRHKLPRDPVRGHCQAGSLTGAVHLSKNNAGVPQLSEDGNPAEQKGKSWFDPDVQYA